MDANIEQLKTTVGTSLLPVMTELVGWFNSLFGSQEQAADSVGDIDEAYRKSYASIESTTTTALALVTALDELSASTEDAASTEMWHAILSELETTLPGISSVIHANSTELTTSTKALKDWIAQWEATSKQMNQMKAMKDMLTARDTLETEITKLNTDQFFANVKKTGAQEAMDNLGNELLAYMLDGMESKGVSAADIEAMKQFGKAGAENLLARMAGGGNANMVMGSLLEGGDLWKNKSFMQYFTAGDGDADILKQMVANYAAQKEVFDKYSLDYTQTIADYEAELSEISEKILFTQQQLSTDTDVESAAERGAKQGASASSPGTITIYNNIDGQAVASIVTSAVMSNIDWALQTRSQG